MTISPVDIVNGWCVIQETDGSIAPRPSNAVENVRWRIRGAHDDAFCVKFPGMGFPWKGGNAHNVMVLSSGEIRPDIRTQFFPNAFPDADVSLLPQARWNLLPEGIDMSVFWHAVTPSNSLLLTWQNALYGRSAASPTNFQAELFSDGSFVYRRGGHTISYMPVFPFDWDGDGLENSVDPEPLVRGPDAHGTNAEWYNVVCSNVFMAVDVEGVVELRPRYEDVNTNAYYFVNICTEHGPAPLYLNADRQSSLGSPVVIALAGETNRIPLLVGVEYVITSTVPISVSVPEDGFANINSESEQGCTVIWPLDFSVSEFGDGQATEVYPVPYDPGGTFLWGAGGSLNNWGMSSAIADMCPYVANGGCVSFACEQSLCSCGGCFTSGTYNLEGTKFNLPTIWCPCWRENPHGEYPTTPHEDMASRPNVSVSFSAPIVLFENTYTNAPTEIVQRQSTETTLSISAYGGANGAFLKIDTGILESKLQPIIGPDLPMSEVWVPANSDINFEIVYRGMRESDRPQDIEVNATLMAINDISPESSRAKATSVRLEMEAVSTFPTNRARHVFGPLEESRLKVYPGLMKSAVAITGTIPYWGRLTGNGIVASERATTFNLQAKCGTDVNLPLSFSVVEPSTQVLGMPAEQFSGLDWDIVEACSLGESEAGVAGRIWVRVLPNYVSFQHIRLLEGFAPAESIWGCCTNQTLFPREQICHGEEAGGDSLYSQNGKDIAEDNLLGPDRIAFWPPTLLQIPCEGGGYSFNIPWKWYADRPGAIELHDWMTVRQEMTIEVDGTCKIRKNGIVLSRSIGGNMIWTQE